MAFGDTKSRVKSFSKFAEMHHDDRFLFFTLPTSSRRLKATELEKEIDLCFGKEAEFEAQLSECFGETIEIVGLRLELPYDAETRTFHPHFHGIALCDANLNIEDFRDWMREHIVRRGLDSISCDTSLVDPEDVTRVVSYIFKPCKTAYKIAEAGHAEEFRIFVGNLSKRMVRTKGTYAAFKGKQSALPGGDRTGRASSKGYTDQESNGFHEDSSCKSNVLDGPGAPQNVLCGL